MKIGNARVLVPAVLCLLALTTTPALAGIVNGDFETAPPPFPIPNWSQIGGAVQGPPGFTGANGGILAQGPGGPAGIPLPGGWSGSMIWQEFDCGPEDAQCYIRFDYNFAPPIPAVPTAAFVIVNGPAGTKLYWLPPGGWLNAQAVYPTCGELTIAFGIVEKNPVLNSSFYVDNVEDKCDTAPWPADPEALPGEEWPPPESDEIDDAVLGLDAVRNGVPTVSQWGLAVLTLLVLAAGTVVLRRNRALAT